MNYRVIIADDETKILQLIRLLGKWDEYGIEIVDECHDGRATLENIKRNRPDFVISDIKMPELDGIRSKAVLDGQKEIASMKGSLYPVLKIDFVGRNAKGLTLNRKSQALFLRATTPPKPSLKKHKFCLYLYKL